MARTMHSTTMEPRVRQRDRLVPKGPAYRAFSVLYVGFIVLPIVAGIDKFFHGLVDWNQYLSPTFAALLGGNVDLMMKIVGVVEIAAGILVAVSPRIGGLVVCGWLWGIIANLLMIPGYYDVAFRDFGLSLGAFALSRLAMDID